MTVQCACCGAETDHPEFFFNERRSFRTGVRKVCPSCWQLRRAAENRRWLAVYCGVLLLAAGLVLFKPDLEIGWDLLNLQVFYAALYVSLVPHELGHLAAAKFLGLRVFHMIFGSGRLLFSWKTFDVPTELRAWPNVGLVLAGFTTANWFRLKNALFAGAGPLVNASIALAIWKLGDYGNFFQAPKLDRELNPLMMLFAANALICGTNLIPHRLRTGLGTFPSDGLQILRAFFLKRSEIDESLGATHVLEAHALIKEKRLDEAMAAVKAGLERFPANFGLLSLQGSIALEKRDLEIARDCFAKALIQLKEAHAMRPTLYNNIAYADALLAKPELAKEADEYSTAALKAMSWNAALQGTRGAVLVQFGTFEEGCRLLEASVAAAEEPAHKAENLCWMAVAAVRQGQFEEAKALLDQARALDGETLSLKWAQAALDTRESRSPWGA